MTRNQLLLLLETFWAGKPIVLLLLGPRLRSNSWNQLFFISGTNESTAVWRRNRALAPGSGRSRKPALTRGPALHDQVAVETASPRWGGQSPQLWSQGVTGGSPGDHAAHHGAGRCRAGWGPEGVFLLSEVTLPGGPSPGSLHQGLSSARSVVPPGSGCPPATQSSAPPTLESTPVLLKSSVVSPSHPWGHSQPLAWARVHPQLPASLHCPPACPSQGSALSRFLFSILQDVT